MFGIGILGDLIQSTRSADQFNNLTSNSQTYTNTILSNNMLESFSQQQYSVLLAQYAALAAQQCATKISAEYAEKQAKIVLLLETNIGLQDLSNKINDKKEELKEAQQQYDVYLALLL